MSYQQQIVGLLVSSSHVSGYFPRVNVPHFVPNPIFHGPTTSAVVAFITFFSCALCLGSLHKQLSLVSLVMGSVGDVL